MPLFLYTSPDMEILSGIWNRFLSLNPLSDPLSTEIIVTQTEGMSKWLTLKMAGFQGICSNVRFIKPDLLFTEIFRSLNDYEGNIRESPYYSENLAWPVFSLLKSGFLESGEAFPLSLYCSSEIRTMACAAKIADLFDQYSFYRPELMETWERGELYFKGNINEIWQKNLWERLRKVYGDYDPGAVKKSFIIKLGMAEPAAVESMARRICIFGVSSLSPFHLEIIKTLSGKIPVLLFLFTPFPIRGEVKAFTSSLDCMGMEFLKEVLKTPGVVHEHFPLGKMKNNMLSIIQSDLLEETRNPVPVPDNTISVSNTHGALRELQILKDYLLSSFSSDGTLRASDIAVMAPDIENYIPWIEAVFGEASEHPMPYSISDRSAAASNETAAAFLSVLSIPGSRFESEKTVSLLDNPIIGSRFSLDENDLDEIRSWLKESRIFWGLDGAHKKAFECPETPENTWKSGLDRMIAGIALMKENGLYFEGISPMDGIEGEKIGLFEKFLSFIRILEKFYHETGEMRTLEEWRRLLLQWYGNFLKPPEDKEHEGIFIKNTIARLTGWGRLFKGKLGYQSLLSRIISILSAPLSVSGYLNGKINFCSLLPMRSVPFQIICILGLQETAFPRKQPRYGFDLSGLEERALDRNLSKSERYLFLEALHSAGDKIYFSYQGRNIQDNSTREMSLPLADLMDHIGNNYFPAEKLITEHPLQPFSIKYAQEHETALYTYSTEFQELARRIPAAGRQYAELLPKTSNAPQNIDIKTDDLVKFFSNPAKYYLHDILRVTFPVPFEMLPEEESFTADGLLEYSIFRDYAFGDSAGRRAAALNYYSKLYSEGRLPHGDLGISYFNLIFDDIFSFYDKVCKNTGPALPDLEVGKFIEIDGVRVNISGFIGDLYEAGLSIFRPAKKIAPKDKTGLWVKHVILNCCAGEKQFKNSRFTSREDSFLLERMPEPEMVLQSLVRLFISGMNGILPFIPSASEVFYRGIENRKDMEDNFYKAENAWNDIRNSENRDPYYKYFLRYSDIFNPQKSESRRFAEASGIFYKPMFESLPEKTDEK